MLAFGGDAISPFVGGGAAVGLLVVLGALIRDARSDAKDLRAERTAEVKELRTDVAGLKLENERIRGAEEACRIQVNSLVSLLQRSDINLPDWLIRGREPAG